MGDPKIETQEHAWASFSLKAVGDPKIETRDNASPILLVGILESVEAIKKFYLLNIHFAHFILAQEAVLGLNWRIQFLYIFSLSYNKDHHRNAMEQ